MTPKNGALKLGGNLTPNMTSTKEFEGIKKKWSKVLANFDPSIGGFFGHDGSDWFTVHKVFKDMRHSNIPRFSSWWLQPI